LTCRGGGESHRPEIVKFQSDQNFSFLNFTRKQQEEEEEANVCHDM